MLITTMSQTSSTVRLRRRQRASSTRTLNTSRAGLVPVEMRGETPFPAIGELPYLVTLGPYDFYWFELTDPAKKKTALTSLAREIDSLPPVGEIYLQNNLRQIVERQLQNYLPAARWYSSTCVRRRT